MSLERSTISASQLLASFSDIHGGNAQCTGDECGRLSAGLDEPHLLALALLRRGHLDFCMIRVYTLSVFFLTLHYYTKLGQPHCSLLTYYKERAS